MTQYVDNCYIVEGITNDLANLRNDLIRTDPVLNNAEILKDAASHPQKFLMVTRQNPSGQGGIAAIHTVGPAGYLPAFGSEQCLFEDISDQQFRMGIDIYLKR